MSGGTAFASVGGRDGGLGGGGRGRRLPLAVFLHRRGALVRPQKTRRPRARAKRDPSLLRLAKGLQRRARGTGGACKSFEAQGRALAPASIEGHRAVAGHEGARTVDNAATRPTPLSAPSKAPRARLHVGQQVDRPGCFGAAPWPSQDTDARIDIDMDPIHARQQTCAPRSRQACLFAHTRWIHRSFHRSSSAPAARLQSTVDAEACGCAAGAAHARGVPARCCLAAAAGRAGGGRLAACAPLPSIPSPHALHARLIGSSLPGAARIQSSSGAPIGRRVPAGGGLTSREGQADERPQHAVQFANRDAVDSHPRDVAARGRASAGGEGPGGTAGWERSWRAACGIGRAAGAGGDGQQQQQHMAVGRLPARRGQPAAAAAALGSQRSLLTCAAGAAPPWRRPPRAPVGCPAGR